ncbi:MAG: hypothetical protein GX283_03205 [Clostridiaceae bacterium]|jgi:hypothetical protein|nr:hypothetical protein [Clostridiaceae bacterium]
MPIKPIDLQVMMPKVVEVSRIQADEQQRNIAMLQNKVEDVETQSEKNIEQVNSREDTYEVSINNQNRGNRREPQKHNKKKKPDEKDTEKVSDITKNPTSGNFIDVRL